MPRVAEALFGPQIGIGVADIIQSGRSCEIWRGGLHVLPAFGQILFDVGQGTQTKLPPDVSCIFLFGHEHLP